MAGGNFIPTTAIFKLGASTCNDNQAEQAGGAFWTAQGSTTISESEFYGNIAHDGHGGAIFSEAGSININDVSFTGNHAQRGDNFNG